MNDLYASGENTGETVCSSCNSIVEVHRKERKELQNTITRIRHMVPKGDKKKKKEAQAEILKLEQEMKERHRQELSTQHTADQRNGDINHPSRLESLADPETSMESGKTRISKAQKRRNKKEAAERELSDRLAQAELESKDSAGAVERRQFDQILSERGLKVFEVAADGNCLYSAIRHQLAFQNIEKSVQELRHMTADEIRAHPEDYRPFLLSQTGETLSNDEFDAYCTAIVATQAWAGHVEIEALSRRLGLAVEVVQASGGSIWIPARPEGAAEAGAALTVTYHQKALGLGEHYNSNFFARSLAAVHYAMLSTLSPLEKNEAVERPSLPWEEPISTGTSLIAVEYNGGVVIGADSRTSAGPYVTNRVTDKLTRLTDNIFCCRSGSAADTQAVADIARYHLDFLGMQQGEPPTVSQAAHVIRSTCYQYRDQLTAGIIVAGWDRKLGGQVYSIPLGGPLLRQPFAIGGSGSTYVYGYCDTAFKEGMSREDCLEFCKSALALAISRDGSSGGVIRLASLDKDGVRRHVITEPDIPKYYQG